MQARALAIALLLGASSSIRALSVDPYLSLHAGSQWHDGQLLENYRWETGAHGSFGAEAGLEHHRWQLGLRVLRSSTIQDTGIPGISTAPRVNLTETSLVLGRELFASFGFALRAHVVGGMLHLGYSPDSATYDLGGGSSVNVDYAPIDEWQFGAGLGVLRQFSGPVALGLHAEYERFGLDTVHRAGTDIEEQRDRFGIWTVRASLHFTWSGR